MSAIPNEIPGFGGAHLAPRQDPSFAPGAEFTTEDYYVFSRCDGVAKARDIVVMVGLGADKACAILGKLRRLGALLLPGETSESAASARAAAERVAAGSIRPRRPSDGLRSRPLDNPPTQPPGQPLDLPAAIDLGPLSSDEAAAMSEPVELTERERRRIIEMLRMSSRATSFDLLGVLPTADKRDLKRAYFKLSKELHPDRYYNKALGSFGPWLTQIFEAIARAYEQLSDDRQRGAYEAKLRGEAAPAPVQPHAQTKADHAAMLFDRACDQEHRGQMVEALKLFGAAIRTDEQPRYLRRAALCALAAGQLGVAEEYATRGAELRPTDPAYARVLAEVLRAAGKLEVAETTLVRALDLRTENDVLAGELRAELAAVRAARTRTD